MENKLNISEIVKTSWQYLKSNIWVFIGLMVGYLIIAGILQNVGSTMLLSGSMLGYLIVTLILLVIQCIFQLGYFKMILDSFKGQEPAFSAFGQQMPKLLNYLGASILVGLAVLLGLVLLILPGIFLAIRLQYFNLFIIEDNAGPIEAIEKSWNLTKGKELDLFLLMLVYILIVICGAILLGIGLLVALPLVYVCVCYVFVLLRGTNAVTEGETTPTETLQ